MCFVWFSYHSMKSMWIKSENCSVKPNSQKLCVFVILVWCSVSISDLQVVQVLLIRKCKFTVINSDFQDGVITSPSLPPLGV